MGSLILGHDMMNNNWQLKVDEDKRKKEAIEYMERLKKRLVKDSKGEPIIGSDDEEGEGEDEDDNEGGNNVEEANKED